MMLMTRNIDAVVREMLAENKYTHDMLLLNKNFSYVPVFVYGTQQHRFSENDLLRGMPRIGMGMTVSDDFTMYTCDGEPVVFEEPKNPKKGRVYGEVFVVPPVVVADLDRRMCRGYHFHRTWRKIVFWEVASVLKPHPKTFEADAMMYHANEPVWAEAINSGKADLKSRSTLKDANGPFYRYLAAEDDQQVTRRIM